jgi:hypothetical protein
MPPALWRWVTAVAAVLLLSGCTATKHPSGQPATHPPSAHGPTWAVKDPAQLAAPPRRPAKPDGPTVEVPSTIDRSCKTDVTSALNDVLSVAKDNSTLVFPRSGCFRVDGTLTLDDHHRFAIEGNGATLKAGTVGNQSRSHFLVSASEDIAVRDLVVVGSNDKAGATPAAYDPDLAFQHGFQLSGVHRVLLEHVAASRLHGDFVYVGGHKRVMSTDVTVATSTFDGSGRQGISITNADRVLIVDNDIANVARSLIDLEPNKRNHEARDVRISGNRTGAATNFWLANKGAGNNIGRVEIDDNTMQRATGGLFFAFAKAAPGRGPWLVRGNRFIANNAVTDEGAVGAFLFAFCHDVVITDNRVTFPPGGVMPAIELRTSRNVHVKGNDFTGASQQIMADGATRGVTTS